MTSLMSKLARPALPVERLNEPDQGTLPFAASRTDLDGRASKLRTEEVVRYGHAIAKTLAALWHLAVVRPIGRWLEHERAIRELSLLNDRELQDIGVAPGMIPYAVSSRSSLNDASNIANENSPKRAA